LVAVAWGFGAAIIMTVLPMMVDSADDVSKVLGRCLNTILCRPAAEPPIPVDENDEAASATSSVVALLLQLLMASPA
jgi:hypothetical protein